MQRLILFFIFLLLIGCGEKPPVNIYDSDEYKNLTKKEIDKGIDEIKLKYNNQIKFTDTLKCISFRK